MHPEFDELKKSILSMGISVSLAVGALVGVGASSAVASTGWTPRAASHSYKTISVAWPKQPKTAKYKIVLSPRYNLVSPTKVTYVKGTKSSVNITLPSSWRGGKGLAVYGKLFAYKQSKSTHRLTQSHSTKTFWLYPKAPQTFGKTKTRIAAYNTLQNNGDSEHSYMSRRTAIRNTIKASKADIVGIEEATTHKEANGNLNFDDIAQLVKPYGYKLTYKASSVKPTHAPNSDNSHILYKPSKFSVSSTGIQDMQTLTHGISWKTSGGKSIYNNRFGWAFLHNRKANKTIFVVAVHLPVGNDAQSKKVRRAAAKGIVNWMARKNRKKVPEFLIGDFNASFKDDGYSGAQKIVTDAGFYDNVAAQHAYNVSYGTSNYGAAINQYGGFPPAPNRTKIAGTRIDYIMSKYAKSPRMYKTQLILNADGTFKESYQGSDHNLVMADVTY